jgi:uncharacterized protein
MSGEILLDTGPLLAYLNARDHYHGWAVERFPEIRAPMLTCEPVLTEAAALLLYDTGDATPMMELLRRGVVQIAFDLEDEAESVSQLMKRYRNVPMALADACLVRMSELRKNSTVFTINSDFHIYRRQGRLVIPTLMPPPKS